MTGTLTFFRANPGLAIVSALVLLGTLVLGLIALMMHRANASLRPIVFVAGFMAIVVAPQFAFHLAQAMEWIPKRSLTWTPGGAPGAPPWSLAASRLAVRDGRFADPSAVFGDTHDPALRVDLRTRVTGGPFADARAAEMAVLAAGSTLLVARFGSADEAARAADVVAAMMLGADPPLGPDGARTVRRANDVAKLVVADDALLVWSALDEASVDRMLATSPLVSRRVSPPDAPAADFWLYRLHVLVPLVLALVLVAAFWFFRMATWASETPARADVTPVDAGTLRQRLLAVNELDVPFRVEASDDDPSALVVTWRWADAKWVDLQRARGMRRTHRIVLRIDERDHTVRPTEQVSRVDWSAGVAGASARWMTQRGIVFFQQEQGRVFGLQIGPDGRFTPNLSHAYRFDLQEMKAPFVQAVTGAGWRWRPTLLHGPAWLAWLTE